MNAPQDDRGPAAFFTAMSHAFDATILNRRGRSDFVGALCLQAFDSFEGNVAIQMEGAPSIACKGDCPACCVLRVVATAPEIFLVARFVAANARALAANGVDILGRIAETNAIAAGRPERERMALARICPFIEHGLCLAYRVRPLACRGHASYDQQACLDATAGSATAEAVVSTPHLMVRSLVQNAMMSSLRTAELAFGLYELNEGVALALATPDSEERWTAGDDPLAPAAIPDFDAAEAAEAFDALRAG
jgi:Fe-S-cluster containining protein